MWKRGVILIISFILFSTSFGWEKVVRPTMPFELSGELCRIMVDIPGQNLYFIKGKGKYYVNFIPCKVKGNVVIFRYEIEGERCEKIFQGNNKYLNKRTKYSNKKEVKLRDIDFTTFRGKAVYANGKGDVSYFYILSNVEDGKSGLLIGHKDML